MVRRDLFGYQDYRAYLREVFSGKGEERGKRLKLAQFLKCHPSLISQVLTDRLHLNLEHAIKTAEFLGLTEEEARYFILLVSIAKAGTRSLENHYQAQLDEIRKKREEIKERIKVPSSLTGEDQAKYYSTWYYSAIHIICALPGPTTPESIAQLLSIEIAFVKRTLQFLEEKGFVRSRNGEYSIGSARVHLPPGSPMLPRHHANWRLRAMEAIDLGKTDELHYSAVLAIAKKDHQKFRERLLQVLEEFEPVIRESKEEVPVVLLMDLFEL